MNSSSLKPLVAALAIALGLIACDRPAGDAGSNAPSAGAAVQPHVAFDISDLDPAIEACTDFNDFVNSKWIAANPIPGDKTRWGAFDVLREKSLETQRGIVEDAATKADGAAAGSNQRLVGLLYRSGMDEAAIEKAGSEPIQAELAKIDALATRADLITYLGDSFARGQGTLFAFGSESDLKNSTRRIAYAFQGGLGLPSRDYYDQEAHAAIRDAYVAHVARVLELTGVEAGAAALQAKAVVGFESRLAAASFGPVELRNPENLYHFVSIDEANRITPQFDWNAFFAAHGIAPGDGFSLSQPAFFGEVDKLLAEADLDTWKAYLRFHYSDNASPYLSTPFQEAHFAFHRQTLSGQKEIEPRWKRVLATVNGQIGMALGEIYVAQAFPPESRARAQTLIDNLQAALRTRIENLDWMSETTKARALEKWSTFLPKIGYPEKWRDWSGLDFGTTSYFANVESAIRFNHAWDVARFGAPTDRLEWLMTPQTVNAYYNPTDNTINFPAAILQAPFFDAQADDALNYGAIGAIIGHEASHGFDDQGSQFDAQGNNTNWWTDEDKAAFQARTARLVEQFNAYEPLPGKRVNGELTLGENIADLGGLAIAWDALQTALAQNPGTAGRLIDGYTQEQRFFFGWARAWRTNMTEKRLEMMLNTDPHSPPRYRANGAPSNLPAFATTFSCKEGDPMVRSADQQVKIW